ncbi:hypothetical protein PMZ80_005416 [Knufia obscura]|uniref:BTB domain-containing protein n=1 Tax=Knufia obscura TaxID=1635080 RepID=A0ABR0RQG3_9EURO|nr:hypothetical protein PMZ80_005416 [Knufia obscura]
MPRTKQTAKRLRSRSPSPAAKQETQLPPGMTQAEYARLCIARSYKMAKTSGKTAPDDISSAQLSLLRDGKFSDMTVSCKGRTWKCHQSVLRLRCHFFEAACSNGFKESDTLAVNLDEDPQDGVDMMLEYLYTLQKPIHPTRAKAETVYTIADKYDLQQLRLQALDVLMNHTGMICFSWERKSEEEKADTIDWIRKVRSWEQQNFAQLREICLRRLSGMSGIDARP